MVSPLISCLRCSNNDRSLEPERSVYLLREILWNSGFRCFEIDQPPGIFSRQNQKANRINHQPRDHISHMNIVYPRPHLNMHWKLVLIIFYSSLLHHKVVAICYSSSSTLIVIACGAHQHSSIPVESCEEIFAHAETTNTPHWKNAIRAQWLLSSATLSKSIVRRSFPHQT